MKTKLLLILSLASLAFSFWYVFEKTPMEINQGFVQKIMYIHVPTIMIAYLLFFIGFFCSIGVLWKKNRFYDVIACSSIEIGTLYTAIALITGSIWGKPTWNTYWTWDAKLTITLITFILYGGYSLLRLFSEHGEKQMISSAVLGSLAFISIPLNHLSVTWWRTLHQPSTFFAKKDAISPELRDPLYFCLVAFLLFTFWLLLKRIELEKQRYQYMEHFQRNLEN